MLSFFRYFRSYIISCKYLKFVDDRTLTVRKLSRTASDSLIPRRAIEASLEALQLRGSEAGEGVVGGAGQEQLHDPELLAALELSAQEQAQWQHALDAEQQALDEALRLSLLDK